MNYTTRRRGYSCRREGNREIEKQRNRAKKGERKGNRGTPKQRNASAIMFIMM